MASKPKPGKTYIMHHRGLSPSGGFPTVLGRYRVGAKNVKDAEKILRNEIGKHAKVKVYYETTHNPLPYGMVIKEFSRK